MRYFTAAGLTLALLSTAIVQAHAQDAPRKAIRGVVQTIDGKSIAIRAKDGGVQSVALTPGWNVRILTPIDVSAIHPGSFIGTAQMPQPDGSGKSLEVHVFPPGVKAGEGERDWDSKPGARMTNGTVDGQVTTDAKGRELTLTFPGGSRKITIPPDVPIVQFAAGRHDQIKPGVPVFVVAMPDGAGWKTGSVSIGQNGAAPPM